MDDRTLVERAAKAAGIEGVYRVNGYRGTCGINAGMDAQLWNPLLDDGDALRLAIKLDIVPRCINGVAFAWRAGVCDMQEPYGTDPCAATRRAIVRAAAALAGD